MNSETKTKIKNRIILGLIGLFLANYFLIIPAGNAKAASDCAEASFNTATSGESASSNTGDCIVATLSNVPAQITLGQDFTFNVALNNTEYAKDNPLSDMSVWSALKVFICDDSVYSGRGCASSDPHITQEVAVSPISLKGANGTVPVTTSFTSALNFASTLPKSLTLHFDFALYGTNPADQSQLFMKEEIFGKTAQATINAPDKNAPLAVGVKVINTSSGLSSTGVSSFEIQGSINGQFNPSGYGWQWTLTKSDGTTVPIDAISKDHTDFTLDDSVLQSNIDYTIFATVTDTSQTPPKVYKSDPPTPLKVASSPDKTPASNSTPGCLTSPLTCIVTTVVILVTGIIKALVLGLFSLIVLPVMTTVLSIQPHEPAFAAVILQGWVVIRNLMNIMFILGLLVIGIATLLRIEKYNYRHLLLKLILWALLINFSLVIGQAILSVADTFQAQFLPASANVVARLGVQLIAGDFINQFSNVWQTGGSLSAAISILISLVFSIGAFFAMAAVTAFLVIRIVALWILLMISPVAYALNILPDTEHYAKEWWSSFLKYAFFTPIMALFLHLCALISIAQQNYVTTATGNALIPSGPGTDSAILSYLGGSFQTFIYNILTSILSIVCLAYSLQIAQKFSIYGAGAVTNWAQKQALRPFQYAGNAAKRAGLGAYYGSVAKLAENQRPGLLGGLARGTSKILGAPGFLAERTHRQEEALKSKQERAGAAVSRLSKLGATGGVVDNNATQKLLNEQSKKSADIFMGQKGDAAMTQTKKLLDAPGMQKERTSQVWALAQNGGLKVWGDDILKRSNETDANGNLTEQAQLYRSEFGLDAGDKEYNDATMGKILGSYIGSTDQGRIFMGTELTDWALKNGRPELAFHAVSDGAGGYRLGTDVAQAPESVQKMLQKANGGQPLSAAQQQVSLQSSEMLNYLDKYDTEKLPSEMKFKSSMFGFDSGGNMNLDSRAMLNTVAKSDSDSLSKMPLSNAQALLFGAKADAQNGMLTFEKPEDFQKFNSAWSDGSGNIRSELQPMFKVLVGKSIGQGKLENLNFSNWGAAYKDSGGQWQSQSYEVSGGGARVEVPDSTALNTPGGIRPAPLGTKPANNHFNANPNAAGAEAPRRRVAGFGGGR